MKTIISLIIVSLLSSVSFAHEGHDHDAPTSLQPKKGGVIKELEEASVEVVNQGKNIEIYFFDKNGNPEDVSKYKVSAVAQLPRSKKKDVVPLISKPNSFQATYDGKGIHRYTLILDIKAPNGNHTDKVKFTIEPKK